MEQLGGGRHRLNFIGKSEQGPMLEEKLRLLEERITALLGDLKTLRRENKSLQEENKLLRLRVQEAETVSKENGKLQEKVAELEGEISAGTEKEQEIRERLRTIIEKITDDIEMMSGQE